MSQPGEIAILTKLVKPLVAMITNIEAAHLGNFDSIEDIARGDGPENFRLALGYTGWGPGQLNNEISDNAWISFDENSNLIFKINPSDQINEISKIVGYDIRMISPNFGNA